MQNLKDECEEAWAWLSKIPVECWEIHVMDTNCKTDLVVNNPSEVFNKIILDVRGIPIKTVIEGMRMKHLVTNEGKKIGFSYSRWYINPTYCEMLEENKKWSRNYKSMQYVENLWQVSRGNESIYVVNLEARTCGCRRWDVSGIPCNHAIFFVYKSRQQPKYFVHDFFKKSMHLRPIMLSSIHYLVKINGQRLIHQA
jgi:hypothetical protein